MTLQPTWIDPVVMSRGPAHARRRAVQARFAEIEAAFGNPWDAAAPLGFVALLAAEEAATVPPEALALTRALRLNAEFVPTALGGDLDGVDVLGVLLRPVFRRDVTLAVRSVLTCFMASTHVWINGSAEQQRLAADVLREGGSIAIAFQRFAHGNDFVNDELTVARTADGLALGGRKRAVNNADDAELLVAFARTLAPADAEDYSALLVPLGALRADGGARLLERVTLDAVPGLDLRGLAFDDCLLPSGALLGSWGEGVEQGLRAYPVTHAAAPGMLIGVADTALRTAARFAVEVGAAGRPLERSRTARHALAATFADLLVGDCLSLVAGRALHLVPEQCNAVAAIAKYVVPTLLEEALNHLSVVMGDAFHAGGGAYGIFAKQVRDLAMVSFGHVSSAVCQVAIVPCLPGIAAEPAACGAAPDAIFQRYGTLPPLDGSRLAAGGGHDGLAAWFLALTGADPDPAPGGTSEDPLAGLLARQLGELRAEFTEIFAAAVELPQDDQDPEAAALAFPLVDRYALAVAAVCCVGVHRQARTAVPGQEGDFLAGRDWLVTALDRLLRRAGRSAPAVPKDVAERLCAEVLRRSGAAARSLDLYDLELAG